MGTKSLYLADTFWKLIAGSKLEIDKDFGIKGFIVKVRFCKSRSNESGNEVEIVFEQKRGICNVLTNFLFAKKAGLLKGNGRAYYFDFAPDFKFTQKNFREKYYDNPEFAEQFDEMMEDLYKEFIYQPELYDKIETSEENLEDDNIVDNE